MTYTAITLAKLNHGVKPYPEVLATEFKSIETNLAAAAGGSGSALASTKFIVGNGAGTAAPVNMSGDATLANTGAVTVAAGIKTKLALLTAGMGTRTALVTSGVDLASGSNAVYYGVFFAPVEITAVSLEILLNEVYVKNAATDALVILKDSAGSPVTIFTTTLNAAGVAAGTQVSVAPETGAATIAAGTRLNLYITATGASGTGYVDVVLKYRVN